MKCGRQQGNKAARQQGNEARVTQGGGRKAPRRLDEGGGAGVKTAIGAWQRGIWLQDGFVRAFFMSRGEPFAPRPGESLPDLATRLASAADTAVAHNRATPTAIVAFDRVAAVRAHPTRLIANRRMVTAFLGRGFVGAIFLFVRQCESALMIWQCGFEPLPVGLF